MKKDSSIPAGFQFEFKHYGLYHLLITILIGAAYYGGAKAGWALSFAPDHIAVFCPRMQLFLRHYC